MRVRTIPYPICRDCLPRLARFILDSPRNLVARFWAIRKDGDPLGVGFPRSISAKDVQTHASLARAYGEMHLPEDALAEAATAILNGAGLEPVEDALVVIFEKKLRYEDGLWVEELRAALFPV